MPALFTRMSMHPVILTTCDTASRTLVARLTSTSTAKDPFGNLAATLSAPLKLRSSTASRQLQKRWVGTALFGETMNSSYRFSIYRKESRGLLADGNRP
jgi:hypothetical protein